MIYGLVSSIGLAALFLFLFIRGAIANGKLKNQVAELSKNADTQQKQLNIAADPNRTPDELAKRMHDGQL